MKPRAKVLPGLILVAGVIAGVWLLAGRERGSKHAVEAYKRQLLAQGEKLAVSALVPIVPQGSYEDSQNFLQAISMAQPVTNEPPAMKYIAPGRAMVAWQQEILPSTADKVSNIWPGLSVELRANHVALTNVRAALDIPVLYFKLDYSKGFGLMLPHLTPLRHAEHLAADATIAALHDKQYAEAWTNLRCATTLVRLYQAEPLIISHLVKIAAAHFAIHATWEFLQSDQWTDAQLAELQAEWESMEFFNSAEPGFLMERAMSVDFFAQARKSWNFFAAAGMPVPSGGGNPPSVLDDPLQSIKTMFEHARYGLWKHSWSYEEELFYLQNHAAGIRAIRETRTTGAAAALKQLRTELAGITQLHANAATHFMAGMGSDWINSDLTKSAEAETARRLLVAAIALRRYQLRHGEYPAELKALVPEFLPQVPLDLMDGKALRYHRSSDGDYVLYSVGDDGEDNHGDATPTEKGNPSFNWLKGRDIVWPKPATAEQIAGSLPVDERAKMPSRQNASPAGTNASAKQGNGK